MNQYNQNFMYNYETLSNGEKIRRKMKKIKKFLKDNNKCVFACILAALILSISVSCLNNPNRKFKNFELVDAVALDEPTVFVRNFLGSSGKGVDYKEEWDYITPLKDGKQPDKFVFDDKNIAFDASVSVDVNNDGKHDLWLHIITRDDKNISTEQNYALQTNGT